MYLRLHVHTSTIIILSTNGMLVDTCESFTPDSDSEGGHDATLSKRNEDAQHYLHVRSTMFLPPLSY